MAGTAPTRIDEDVANAAKAAGELLSRSAAQQVNHWARIGRELEASKSVSQREVAQVLGGRSSYDALNVREQAVVRAEWNERMTALREGLDLAAEFSAAGQDWVEADKDGKVVKRSPQQAARKRAPRRRAS
ncbi:MAG: hypothetical protein QOE84_2372 [Actinomycetota bacterium]|nr:hypothetical protein [Actinomycetota bacterium]